MRHIPAIEVGVVMVNADGLITSVSSCVEEWTGRPYEAMRHEPLATLFREGDRKRIARLTSGNKESRKQIVACRLNRRNGESLLVDLLFTEITPAEGFHATILVNHETSGTVLQSTLRSTYTIPVAAAFLDAAYRVHSVTANWEEATGIKIEEAIDQRFHDLFPRVGDQLLTDATCHGIVTIEGTGGTSVAENNGSPSMRSLQVSILSIIGDADEHVDLIAAILDVTGLDKFVDYFDRQNAILDQVSDAVIIADADFHIVSWNAGAERMYGWPAKDVLGKEISEVVELRFHERTRDDVREQVLTQGKWMGRGTHFDREGKSMTVSSSISVLKDAEGRITGTVSVNRDITQIAETEEALRHSESLFRSVVSNLGEGLLLTDETGTVLYLNDRLAGMTGYDASDVIGRNFYKLFFSEDRWPDMKERVEACVRGTSERYQTEIVRSEGSRLWVEINTSPFYSEDREIAGTLSLVADISERRALEERLLERDRLLQTTANASAALIQNHDLSVSINRALQILGEGLDADRVYIFQNHRRPDSGEILSSQIFEWAREGVQAHIDNPVLQDFPLSALPRWEQRLTAGKVIFGPVSEVPDIERIILESQEIKSILVVPIMLDGAFWGFIGYDDCRRERSWSENERALMLAVSGSIGSAVKRMQTERDIQVARDRAEKANERSSRFLANMSHEFRSPLAVVLGYADLMKALVDTGDEVPTETLMDSLGAIRRSGKRLQALVHNLLDIGSIEEGTLHMISNEVEINSLVENVVEEQRPAISDKALELKVELWPDTLSVRGDPVRVEEIVTNLVENAVKFTREGFIAVRTQKEHVQDRCSVVIEVEDSGVGISEEYLGQIFNPFTQESSGTTRAFEGAGLGLALSQRLAALMGGTIKARSRKGKGSAFIVRLPCAEQKTRFQPGPALMQSQTALKPTGEPFLPQVVIVGPRKPIYRLWEHFLSENCTFTYAPSLHEAKGLVAKEDPKIVVVDESEGLDHGDVKHFAEELRNAPTGESPVLVGAYSEETGEEQGDAETYDDTIAHFASLDVFFEKFMGWLPDAPEQSDDT